MYVQLKLRTSFTYFVKLIKKKNKINCELNTSYLSSVF